MIIIDWQANIKTMSTGEIETRLKALETLEKWPEFCREFEGFGTFNLAWYLRLELRDRRDALVIAERQAR